MLEGVTGEVLIVLWLQTFNITLSSRLILIDDAEATQHNRHQLAANTSGLVGTWGMVFDEGFEVI